MAQIQIKDALGVTQTAALVPNTGQTLSSNAMPITLASEFVADIGFAKTVRTTQQGITYYNSLNNNTSAELSNGSTWIGAWEDVFNQPAIQILATSNQPMEYTVEQQIDAAGTYINQTIKFTRGTNENLSECVQVNSNYVRISAKNVGYTQTSNFELNTTFGPLNPLPQSLSNAGNFKVSSRETQNFTRKLRDHFQQWPNNNWPEISKASGDIITIDGNAAGAQYLVMSLDPLTAGTESYVCTDAIYEMPMEIGFGAHLSQRTYGQEVQIQMNSEESTAVPSELTISSIQQTTTTLTVSTTAPHNLKIGDRIGIYGVTQDSRLNYAALVVATTPTTTQFTSTAGPQGTIGSLTVGPFVSGYVYKRDALQWKANGTSIVFENGTVTNSSFYVKAEGGDAMPIGGTLAGNHSVTIGSTTSAVAASGTANYAFRPTNQFTLTQQADKVQWQDAEVDVITQATSRANINQICPNPDQKYEIRLQIKNRKGLTVPTAKIVSVSKSGTTTATVTTESAHNLIAGDYIVMYGVRNTGDFPNTATATQVASTPTATTFTIVWGATTPTITSYGGLIARVQGQQILQGVTGQNISTIQRTSNIVVLVGSATWAGLVIGDYVNVYGAKIDGTGADAGIDGAYRVRDLATTTLTLEPITGANPASPTGNDISTTNAGGSVIKRTDLRMSFVRLFDYERLRVEPLARPAGDISSTFPVAVQNTPAVTVSSGTVTTVSTVTSMTSGNLGIPGIIADIASAALTTTTTTAAVTPTYGCSYEVNVPVTAVTGTTPTLDIGIEESDDTGTNWFRVYDFPRITATGIYRSPKLPLTGNRIRYVQTVGGTTPSFTRSLNRLQCSDTATCIRTMFDRSITLTTLSSTTPTMYVEGTVDLKLTINIGAATTAPVIQMQISEDASNWIDVGSPLTAIASSTVHQVAYGCYAKFARAIVKTAGNTVTAGYVHIRAF